MVWIFKSFFEANTLMYVLPYTYSEKYSLIGIELNNWDEKYDDYPRSPLFLAYSSDDYSHWSI